jgi:hypothetical protein
MMAYALFQNLQTSVVAILSTLFYQWQELISRLDKFSLFIKACFQPNFVGCLVELLNYIMKFLFSFCNYYVIFYRL